jgi:hypothetical protein
VKLRVEVISCAGVVEQAEEFELNEQAEDTITSVNSMTLGQVRATVVAEYPVCIWNLTAGMVPRRGS